MKFYVIKGRLEEELDRWVRFYNGTYNVTVDTMSIFGDILTSMYLLGNAFDSEEALLRHYQHLRYNVREADCKFHRRSTKEISLEKRIFWLQEKENTK